jgi:hypothetical protein
LGSWLLVGVLPLVLPCDADGSAAAEGAKGGLLSGSFSDWAVIVLAGCCGMAGEEEC